MSSATSTGKSIVLSVSRISFSESSLAEVLRVAVGLSAGSVGHKVAVVFWGDGVVQSLKEHMRLACVCYFKSAVAHGVEFFVDDISVGLRGLEQGQMIEGFSAVSREDLIKKLHDADVHLRM